MGLGTSLQVADPKGVQPEEPHSRQASRLRDAPGEDQLAGLPRSQQCGQLPPILEKKREDPRSPRDMWEPEGEELQQDEETGAPGTRISLENPTPIAQGQEEGAKQALKDGIGTEGDSRDVLPSAEGQRRTEGTHEGEAEQGHAQRLLVSRGTTKDATSGSGQQWEVPSIPGEPCVLKGLGTEEGSTTEKPQEPTGATSVTRREKQAEVALRDVVKVTAVQLCACLFSSL